MVIVMARTNLKLAPAARSPERVVLRAAVDRHAAALRRIAANSKAQEATADAIRGARKAVASATAALEQAKTDAGGVVAGTIRTPQLTVKTARAELMEAEDALEAATAAASTLTTQRAEAESELVLAGLALDDRIRAVVRSDATTAKMLADFARSQREMVSLRRALECLDGSMNALPEDSKFWNVEPVWPELSAQAERVKTWIEALQTDSDAVLILNSSS
jgi:chromosome segregation ATPase